MKCDSRNFVFQNKDPLEYCQTVICLSQKCHGASVEWVVCLEREGLKYFRGCHSGPNLLKSNKFLSQFVHLLTAQAYSSHAFDP